MTGWQELSARLMASGDEGETQSSDQSETQAPDHPDLCGAGAGPGTGGSGLYQPPWKYSPQQLALDLSHHLVYGVGTQSGHMVIARATS